MIQILPHISLSMDIILYYSCLERERIKIYEDNQRERTVEQLLKGIHEGIKKESEKERGERKSVSMKLFPHLKTFCCFSCSKKFEQEFHSRDSLFFLSLFL